MIVARKLLIAALVWILAIAPAISQSVMFPGPGGPVVGNTAIAVNGLGDHEISVAASSIAMTTTAGIISGDLVVIGIAIPNANTISVSSCSDGTNTYTQAVEAYNAVSTLDTAIWYKQNASAVGSGATITCNFSTTSGGSPGVITAARITNIVTTSALDKTNHTEYTTGTSPSSGSTGTLSQAKEVAFGLVYGYNVTTQPVITEGTGFTTLLTYQQNAAAHVAVNFAYDIVNATTALNYQPTSSQSLLAGSNIATFKGI